MSEQAADPGRLLGPLRLPAVLAGLAVPLVLAAGLLWPAPGGLAAAGAGLSVLLVAGWFATRGRIAQARTAADLAGAARALEADPAPCFGTDASGVVVFQNPAAVDRLGPCTGQTAAAALGALLVNAPAVAFRQETALAEAGHAVEAVFTQAGHVRLTVHRAGSGAIWRLDEAPASAGRHGEGIALPMMLVSPSGTILSSNGAMRSLLGHKVRSFAAAFGGRAPTPGSRADLDTAEGPVPVTVLEAAAGDGRREVYAIPGTDFAAGTQLSAALFEALPVAALLVSGSGGVEAHNAAARALLGIAEGEAELRIGDLVEGPGRPARDWMKDVLDRRVPNRSEVVALVRGGDDRAIRVTAAPLAVEGAPRLLAVLQDATEVQTLQQQFAQSQKMQAIGELAGGVAHDFNNLLTAITGHCDLLLLRHDQGDQDYADLVQIHQNANRAASLVGQLLAFSRKQTMRPELLDLRDTMADLTHLLNRLVGERVTLHLSQDPALQPIWADRRLLDQVLMNLVVNARDAMPEGGPIRITSRMLRLEAALERNAAEVPPGTYVVIEVADTGVGIPADRITRIFEPFFTTKKVGEGTGLGLSMVYGIMKQSGGYIFCDSTVGVGTTFALYFPAHDWPAEAAVAGPETADAEGAADAPRSDTGVILLVEDEAPVRAFASRALRLKGFSVLEAENGDEALEVLEDDELEIDVFVTDMVMPGKSGPDWVREALVNRPGVGVVFTSGYAEDAYGKFPDIPQAEFLAKPFSLAELTEIVLRKMP